MIEESISDAGIWFRVESSSAASAVRRAAERLGRQLGLSAQRTADLAIVAAELSSELVKHAEEGVLLRPVRRDGEAGVELVAIDSGARHGRPDRLLPGRPLHHRHAGHRARRDPAPGSWYDRPRQGRGTVFAVQVWPAGVPAETWTAGLTRPLTGNR
jgi:hypothetical protein